MASVHEIAELTGASVSGKTDISVTRMKHPQYADKGDLTFASSREELDALVSSEVECVMVAFEVPEGYPKTVLRVDDLKKALTLTYNVLLGREQACPYVHPAAEVSTKCKLGRDVHIGAFAVICDGAVVADGSRIGSGCFVGRDVILGPGVRLYPNVTIYDGCRLGRDVTVHASSVIGADGFGYVPEGERILKVPQLAAVVIGDNVEIGANTCIDRGTFTDTVIGDNAKIDNLVQIAHNVKLGKNVIIASQTGVAGSAVVGDNVMMGGQVGVTDHAKVPENVKIGAQSGVTGKLKAGETYLGSPARTIRESRKMFAMLALLVRNLDKLKRLLRELND